jgi:hypothetical protein
MIFRDCSCWSACRHRTEPHVFKVALSCLKVDAKGGADSSAGPATAGAFAPERAAPSEQVVLLMQKPNAGLLTRIARCSFPADPASFEAQDIHSLTCHVTVSLS